MLYQKKYVWATPSEEVLKSVEYQRGKDIIFNNTQRCKKEIHPRPLYHPTSFTIFDSYRASPALQQPIQKLYTRGADNKTSGPLGCQRLCSTLSTISCQTRPPDRKDMLPQVS